MTDFSPYEQLNPTTVRRLEIHMESAYVPELDENNIPTGQDVIQEKFRVIAGVEDQHGVERWQHSANHTRAIDAGIFTVQELQTLRNILQNARGRAEAIVKPPAS